MADHCVGLRASRAYESVATRSTEAPGGGIFKSTSPRIGGRRRDDTYWQATHAYYDIARRVFGVNYYFRDLLSDSGGGEITRRRRRKKPLREFYK